MNGQTVIVCATTTTISHCSINIFYEFVFLSQKFQLFSPTKSKLRKKRERKKKPPAKHKIRSLSESIGKITQRRKKEQIISSLICYVYFQFK